ncbi:dihydroorotase [Salicibibacter kimchii]|uniref:Allantoinase n=1 Tax=Salicibibacter kimchii TaxID=2099786 RepID=A0A345BXQ1_9BACI|nr:dihydroorotase family protein [Salicibibacter kimchii]AXF55732.1 allantoinase [Salicibibacter kimchii]
MYDVKIENGWLVTSRETFPGTIFIQDGKIAALKAPGAKGEAQEVIDAAGKHVLPGLIDTHVHSRDPGPTHKEDFSTSTRAAAAGGITTIFEMPNTTPPVRDGASFDGQVEHLQKKAAVNFGLWGICLGPLNRADFLEMHRKGVIGFKYFWGYGVHRKTFQLLYNVSEAGDEVIQPYDDGEVYAMMKEVAKTGQLFAVHAENHELIRRLGEEKDPEDESYPALLASRPGVAEQLTVETGITLAKAAGVHFHVLHVSAAESVAAVRRAQASGQRVSVETCPHYLFLSDEDYETVGKDMKIFPLVKTKADQKAIWEGINDGTITVVCSDHAPHTKEEKYGGTLSEIPAGMCGVETMVPLMLNAVNEGKLTMNRLVALLAENPAHLYGVVGQKGTFTPGSDGDITIVDMEKTGVIRKEALHSKSKISAYDGCSIKGWPVHTIVSGKTVMQDGELVNERPNGKLVTPGGIHHGS